jgi:hypothetical protein
VRRLIEHRPLPRVNHADSLCPGIFWPHGRRFDAPDGLVRDIAHMPSVSRYRRCTPEVRFTTRRTLHAD